MSIAKIKDVFWAGDNHGAPIFNYRALNCPRPSPTFPAPPTDVIHDLIVSN